MGMKNNITGLEKQWLLAYMQNDIVNDYGWKDKDSCGWTVSISEDSDIVPRSVSGIISSLVKKGLIIVQNHTEDSECKLTDKGIDICRKIQKDVDKDDFLC